MKDVITTKDRKIIRDLAKEVKYRAELPVMETRRAKWFEHNDLKTTDPLVLVFPENAWHEIVKPKDLLCEGEEARRIEALLRGRLFRADVIQDDVPIEKTWEVEKIITDTGWDALNPNHKSSLFVNDYIVDNCLGAFAYLWKKDFEFNPNAGHFEPIIKEHQDLKRLKAPVVTYHEKETMEKLTREQDLLGDILNVELVGKKFVYIAMMEIYTDFRGLEQVMYDIYEEPEMLREAMEIIADGYNSLLDQYVKYDLLEINNRQGYNGSGGMCYTHDLPKVPGGGKDLRNFWGFCESQEFASVSPEHHYEFVMKHEEKISKRFGLFSYGCCDPLENKLKYVLEFPTIRRISVSPWADIKKCSELIQQKAVYSWKPNPAYFTTDFNVEFLEEYIRNMLEITKDNCAEIVLKDTGTCQNEPERYGKFVSLCRRLIEEVRG